MNRFATAGLALALITMSSTVARAAAPVENRTITGSGNHRTTPALGAANTVFRRVITPAYPDDGDTLARREAPNPRAISNALANQQRDRPAARKWSAMFWQWGQFVDHDINLTLDDSGEFANITPPNNDPLFTQPIPFERSDHDSRDPRNEFNSVTSYLDASTVYGSTERRAAFLRTNQGGRLKTTASSHGDLLPYNTAGFPNLNQSPLPDQSLFLAGDFRANDQVALTSLQTLFLREHNHQADRLSAAHPMWSDERLYQRARKLVGAEIESITYRHWLPALLGADALTPYQGYDPQADPRITTVFSTAAMRLGHTLLQPTLLRLGPDAKTIAQGDLSLRQAFFRPDRITDEGGIDPILRGLIAARSQEVDLKITSEVRDFLFGPGAGLDLAALNIQRGRDHGLPDYNAVRRELGLGRVASFSDITSDPALAAALSEVYGGNVDAIDPWIGMLAEDHLPGAGVGETIYRVLVDQFESLRDGDRFFYLGDDALSQTDRARIDATRLSDIIMRNTSIEGLSTDVFVVPEPTTLALLGLGGVGLIRRRRPRRASL